MNQDIINVLLSHFHLVFAPLFLFGAIKMRGRESGWGTRTLIIGFSMLSLVAVLNAAQHFELFEIKYQPYLESDYGYHFDIEWEPWERHYFYAELLIHYLGSFVTSLGFVIQGRTILSSLNRYHEPIKNS